MTGPIAETISGVVEGVEEDGVTHFRGIPYAMPPVEGLRFRPPQPLSEWNGVREAKRFSAAAPQTPSQIQLLNVRKQVTSEDCLYLNVSTPALDDAARPVLVWIHGGAFVTGSGASPWYDPTTFVTRGDTVVVTINYRLGALGFMYVDDTVDGFSDSANLGILDQIAALEWVRDNISAFGGDPERVTIFGESAGAMSIGTLMGTPGAKDLFKQAILQSGAVRHVSDRDEASRTARQVLDELGLDDPSVEDLQSVPVDELLQAQGNTFLKNWGKTRGLPFQPVLDGVVIPEHPLDAIEGGSCSGKPILTGTNKDEMLLYSLIDPRYGNLSDDELTKLATKVFRGEEAGRKAIETYASAHPGAKAGDLWGAIATDLTFRAPAIDLVQRHTGPSYVYLFTYCSPVMEGRLKSCHALEIPFVFDALDAPGVDKFVGPATSDMFQLARAMNTAWASFAHSGRPVSGSLPEWPAYETDSRQTMVLGDEVKVVEDPLREERLLWTK